MAAARGDGEQGRGGGVGFFCPGSPMASTAGLAALAVPTDPAGASAGAALRAAGYRGERIVMIRIEDLAAPRAMAALAAERLGQIGFDVAVEPVRLIDLVPVLLRTQPSGAGGWNVVIGYWSGHDMWHPGMHRYLRAEGRASEVGWPSSERLEAMRRAWLAADAPAVQRDIAAEIQVQAFDDVPYVPLGHWVRPTAYAADLGGVLDGFPLFWNVRRG